MSVNNIEKLRLHAIETLHKLEDGVIDTGEAGVTHKLYESVVSTCKAEMEYNKMLSRRVIIPFLETDATPVHESTGSNVKGLAKRSHNERDYK